MGITGLKRTLLTSLCALGLSLSSLPSVAAVSAEGLFSGLSKSAPGLDPRVLRYALDATQCAVRSGVAYPERLAVIDFSLPSSEQRLWIFDLEKRQLLMRDLVAHGRNSGERDAKAFSNVEGSHQSSIGLFKAAESYRGKHGYSLRLDGLEPGFNDLARQRAIVIHGADYVDPSWVDTYGRIGRSLGCPAVRQEIITEVVDSLKGGQLVFKYYPDRDWLARSDLLHCGDSNGAVAGVSGDLAESNRGS